MAYIDTLKFVNKLKAVGISEPIAVAFSDIQNEVFAEAMNNNIATKSDIDYLVREIDLLASATQRDFAVLRQETKNELQQLEGRMEVCFVKLDNKIDFVETKLESKFRLLSWMFGFTAAGVGSLVLKTFFI